jgi:hypothetical protein
MSIAVALVDATATEAIQEVIARNLMILIIQTREELTNSIKSDF